MAELTKNESHRRRRNFTEEQKISAVRYLEEQRQLHHRSFISVARELGIRDTVLRRWCKQYPAHDFQPVEIIPSAPSTIVLKTPQGFQVEGLNIEQAAQLLRALI